MLGTELNTCCFVGVRANTLPAVWVKRPRVTMMMATLMMMMMTAHQGGYADTRLNQSTKRSDPQTFFHKSVSKIDSRLTDSALSFLLFFSSLSILSSLLRLLFFAGVKTFVFFPPPSFPVCSSHFCVFVVTIHPKKIFRAECGNNTKEKHCIPIVLNVQEKERMFSTREQ